MMQTEFREAIEVRCNAVIGGGPTAVASISALQTIQDQATNHLDGDVRSPPPRQAAVRKKAGEGRVRKWPRESVRTRRVFWQQDQLFRSPRLHKST